jgi:hypothetical protein
VEIGTVASRTSRLKDALAVSWPALR